MPHRTVFFISDGTGITAETFGNAILAQFELKARHVRLPFIDTADKAYQTIRQINHAAATDGNKPIVFTTLVNMEILKILQDGRWRVSFSSSPTTAWAVSATPAKARNTRTGSRRSTSRWPMTTASPIVTWNCPT
jgi:regulator of PEP synthase PpsR (kinase-PPPase family)